MTTETFEVEDYTNLGKRVMLPVRLNIVKSAGIFVGARHRHDDTLNGRLITPPWDLKLPIICPVALLLCLYLLSLGTTNIEHSESISFE